MGSKSLFDVWYNVFVNLLLSCLTSCMFFVLLAAFKAGVSMQHWAEVSRYAASSQSRAAGHSNREGEQTNHTVSLTHLPWRGGDFATEKQSNLDQIDESRWVSCKKSRVAVLESVWVGGREDRSSPSTFRCSSSINPVLSSHLFFPLQTSEPVACDGERVPGPCQLPQADPSWTPKRGHPGDKHGPASAAKWWVWVYLFVVVFSAFFHLHLLTFPFKCISQRLCQP